MNFLAHLYLSEKRPKVMVGNFIGDFVKGRNLQDRFEPEIALGIELHRNIDAYTDSHEVVAQSKNRLRPKYRHYSGVIVDVFYDHFLANNFNDYGPQPLSEFAEYAYSTVQSYDVMLPEGVKRMLPHMISGNWLVNYSKTEGIHQALSGMSRRTPYESKMNEATADLKLSYEDFKKEFQEFFPQIQGYCRGWIEERLIN